MTPRTKAGRALLERESLNSRSFALITAEDIIAIEQEAATPSSEPSVEPGLLSDDEIEWIDDLTEHYVDGSGAATSREEVARLVLLVRRLAAHHPSENDSDLDKPCAHCGSWRHIQNYARLAKPVETGDLPE